MIKGYSDAFLNTGNVKHFFPHVGFYNLYERWLLLIIKIQGLDIKLTLLGDINKLHWKVKGHLKMLDYSFSFFTFFFDFYVRILCFQNGFLLFKSAYSSLQKSEIRIHNSAEQDPILGLILLSCSVQSHALVSSKYKKLFYSCLHPALNRCLRLNQILNAGLPYTALVLSLGPKLKCLLKWYFLWNPILLLPTGWV